MKDPHPSCVISITMDEVKLLVCSLANKEAEKDES